MISTREAFLGNMKNEIRESLEKYVIVSLFGDPMENASLFWNTDDEDWGYFDTATVFDDRRQATMAAANLDDGEYEIIPYVDAEKTHLKEVKEFREREGLPPEEIKHEWISYAEDVDDKFSPTTARYSHKIAFLGKREIKDYQSGSSWIVAKDYSDREWKSEFVNIKNILKDEDIKLKDHAFLYTPPGELCIRVGGDHIDPTSSSDMVYYNKDTGFIFYFTELEYDELVKTQDMLEKFLTFIENNAGHVEDYRIQDIDF